MTIADILNSNGVAARNATTQLTEKDDLYAVILGERKGKNRTIVLDAAKKRCRALGFAEEPPAPPPAEKPARKAPGPRKNYTITPANLAHLEGVTATCTRDGTTTATGPEAIFTVFGVRGVKRKGVMTLLPQPQCKACRKLPPKREEK